MAIKPLDFLPQDLGLDRDYQSAQQWVTKTPMNQALQGITAAPGALLAMQERKGLQNLAGVDFPVNNPMTAFYIKRIQAMGNPKEKVSEETWKNIAPLVGADPDSEPPTNEGLGQLLKAKQVSKPSTSSNYVVPPEEEEALYRAARKYPDRYPPDIFKSRGPQYKFLAHTAYQAEQNGEDYPNPAGMNVGYSAQKTGASATAGVKGRQGFELSALTGSLDDTLRQMEPLIKNMPDTGLQVLNDAWAKGLKQVNDPMANKVLGLANSARGLYSQVLAGGGAGTLESDKKANETISRGLNASSFDGMKQGIMAEGYSRAGRMSGAIPNTLKAPPGYIQPSGETSSPTLDSDPKALQIKKAVLSGKMTKEEGKMRLKQLGYK